ncbi:hypothetical protein ACT17_11885 [Mycolicibacterium conceptionense]|uniref:Uncharacterized protein n=1 Tax=Mycolicibacterium conceptionense TaxID=451644 RepID=A0A0J8WYU1_9MYCO|nr:hypothetical protein ACT17_11885 [Mycolicibacterium conceptionense]
MAWVADCGVTPALDRSEASACGEMGRIDAGIAVGLAAGVAAAGIAAGGAAGIAAGAGLPYAAGDGLAVVGI